MTDLAKALDEIGRLDAERSALFRSFRWSEDSFVAELSPPERAYAIAVLNAAPAMLKALQAYREHLCPMQHKPGYEPAPAPAASLRDGQGWWLSGESADRFYINRNAHLFSDTRSLKHVLGFTTDPAAVLAWVRDGKLPGEAK